MKPHNYNNVTSSNKLILRKSLRILVYTLLLLTIIFINLTSGLFPSAYNEIKTIYNISANKYGFFFFSSAVGKIIGSLIFEKLNNIVNRKPFIAATILLNCIFIIIIRFSSNFLLVLFLKLFMGISEIIIQIFSPLWVQQFGLHQYKVLLTAFIQLSNPLGKILSFYLNFYLSFIQIMKIEGILFGIFTIMFFIIPKQYFASNILILFNKETKEEIVDQREKNVNLYIYKDEEDESNRTLPLLDNDEKEKNTILTKKNNNFCLLLKCKIFLYSLIIRTILIGLQSTILFWTPEIIDTVININKKQKLNLIGNILIIITSPLGSFISGIISANSKLIGNKKKRRTIFIISFLYIISFILAFFVPEKKNLSFIIHLILFSFTISAILPILQSVSISYLESGLNKKDALSFIHIFSLLFGTGVDPLIFGYVYQGFGYSKISAMKWFLNSNLGFGFLLLPILIYLLYKKNYLGLSSKIGSKGFSVNVNDKNGGEEIVQELANAYGEFPNIGKKNKKTNLKSIEI